MIRSKTLRWFQEEESGRAPWYITFSDLLTLLLTFFVMRISMSSLDVESIARPLGMPLEKVVETQQASISVGKKVKKVMRDMLGEAEVLGGGEASLGFPNTTTLTLTNRGVLISLGGGRFLPGSREISSDTLALVHELGATLSGSKVRIRIEGHSDNAPIATTEFPSNWELSAARAISVAQELIAAGVDGGRVAAVGYADTRPVSTNATEEGRAKNRRVEVLIEPEV